MGLLLEKIDIENKSVHYFLIFQDCLYHHPVHKISFIAQDMTDTRAFGYIFGSPDAGHKFFGIKTEKTASQVVIAMRDLFQVSSSFFSVIGFAQSNCALKNPGLKGEIFK
jgi:hypothetical protein